MTGEGFNAIMSQQSPISDFDKLQQAKTNWDIERKLFIAEIQKWKRIRTPTHGSCCTCQACGLDHDSCRCSLDDIADDNERLREKNNQLWQALVDIGCQYHDVRDSDKSCCFCWSCDTSRTDICDCIRCTTLEKEK